MAIAKSCPGSRTIKEPRPELVNCPNCGGEVEIWSDELKATCPNCKTTVFKEQQPSCIDWCPQAKECIGPEVYERLRPAGQEDMAGAGTPLDVLRREHERVLENLGLLRAAGLCLQLGALTPQSAVRRKGIEHLGKVLEFFDKDVALHFLREEEALFPAMEKHLGAEKSPTRVMLREHAEIRKLHGQLKGPLAELKDGDGKHSEAAVAGVREATECIERLLKEHIKKENESLLPLAKSLLKKKEMDEISKKWKTLSV